MVPGNKSKREAARMGQVPKFVQTKIKCRLFPAKKEELIFQIAQSGLANGKMLEAVLRTKQIHIADLANKLSKDLVKTELDWRYVTRMIPPKSYPAA